jgi:hypothetical protein
MKRSVGALVATAALAGAPALASSQQPLVQPGAQSTITLRGFVGATMFLQDNIFGFGNGQNAGWAAANPQTDQWLLSGDIRNSRLGLDFRGPPIGGDGVVGGTIEMDFFGGFANPGPLGDEQPNPRLRLAYADLTRRGTTLRIGQAWSPLFGYAPASVSRLGFPLGLGTAGNVGWRIPGVFVYQALTPLDARTRAQLQLAAMRGSWEGPGPNVDHLSAGETSAFPQLQARLDLGGVLPGNVPWGTYVVGHYDRKNLSGFGVEAPPGQPDELDGSAIAAGLRLVPGPLTLHGSFYTGTAIGQMLGHVTQFADTRGWGAWGQLGYSFDPSWSAWVFYGIDNPNSDHIRTAFPATNARLQNQLLTAMLRYVTGPYQLGAEWLRAATDWWVPGLAPREQTWTGNQYSFSVVYSF